MQMYMSKPRLSVVTAAWANRPSAAVAGALFFAADVGESGTLFQATGTRWRAVNGSATLKMLGDTTGNIAAAETNVLQVLIPAGAWQVNDTIRIWLVTSKSGTTDTATLNVRVGTAGTTGDTAITGLSAFSLMSAAAQSGGSIFDIKLLSATSAQRVGVNGGNTHSYSSPSAAGVLAVATTITDASANALYVSVNLQSSGATNTVAAQTASIQLITP